MAIPHYKISPPGVAPVTPMKDYYRSPETSMQLMHKIRNQHNKYLMEYQNGMHNVPPQGYKNSLSVRRNVVVPQPKLARPAHEYTHTPATNYPSVSNSVPIPTPQQYLQILKTKPKYLSLLKAAADRITNKDSLPSTTISGCSDVQETASTSKSGVVPAPTGSFSEGKRVATPTSFENEPAEALVIDHCTEPVSSPSPEIIVTDEIPECLFRTQLIEPAQSLQPVLEQRSGVGYELASAQDPSLVQKYVLPSHYEPGPGQDYISNINALSDKVQKFASERQPTSTKKYDSQTPTSSGLVQSSIPTESKRRRSTEYTVSQPIAKASCYTWYPRPASANLQYLFIGSNKTCVPASFYATIPWEYANESVRQLMEYLFDDSILATHNIIGDLLLDANIIDDIIGIVSDKCFLPPMAIQFMISKVCADKARYCTKPVVQYSCV